MFMLGQKVRKMAELDLNVKAEASDEPTAPIQTEALAWELLEASPDEIELFDRQGVLVYVNPAAALKRARPRPALVGSCVWDLTNTDDSSQHLRRVVNQVVRSGEGVRFTTRRGDGWGWVEIYPVAGDHGTVDYIATFAHDITLQIRAEEKLKVAALQVLTIQEEERRRIAQDLHDDIGQSMTALILNLKSIHETLKSEPDCKPAEVAKQVGQTIRTVENMMRDLRQVFYELRPPVFGAMPLAKVLESFCSSLAVSTGLRIVFSSQEQLPPIPTAQATAFYRLVQEGVHNIVKHARASSVWINLEFVNSEVNISIEDDGQGFDPTQGPRLGMGLQGLRERFFMLSGSFDLESAPGEGTRLYGSLPIAKPETE